MSKIVYVGTTSGCVSCQIMANIMKKVAEDRPTFELKIQDYAELPQYIRVNVLLTDFPVTILTKDEIIKYHFIGTKSQRKVEHLMEDIDYLFVTWGGVDVERYSTPFIIKLMKEQYIENFKEFIVRCRYDIIEDTINELNHTNKTVKLVDTNSVQDLAYAAVNIFFKTTPQCVVNFFEATYNKTHKDKYNTFTLDKLVDGIMEVFDDYVPTKDYRAKSMVTLFHLWNNKTLSNNWNKTITTMLDKMFDPYDTHFNIIKEEPYKFDIDNFNKELIDFICENNKGAITGSVGMACWGTIYRETIHDIDFILHTSLLGDEINKLVDIEVDKNQGYRGKQRAKLEEQFREMFKQCPIGVSLSELYPNYKVRYCCIDRSSYYDKLVKLTATIIIDDITFDLIFKDKINVETCNIDNVQLKVQRPCDLISHKRSFGRSKDMEDLLLFQPYDTLPDSMCNIHTW